MNTSDKIQKCKAWYEENKLIYESCGDSIKRLLGILLDGNNIVYHSIEYRVKTQESFLKKCDNAKYDKPISQITDLCGLRIISYTNHDVREIQQLIEKEFEIDKENSIDKSKIMREDQVGYLSVHYIATLKKERLKFAEYKKYKNIKFEIQIRTFLQHAWAEIEHDRNYKFSRELPNDIKRRFYLVAGSLELIDREFEHLSRDIDEYAKKIREETEVGNLDEPINSTSLIEYLSIRLKDYEIKDKDFNGSDKDIISELLAFGINKLKDLDDILTDEALDLVDWDDEDNYLGVLRDIMINGDARKYFEKAWQEHWTGMSFDEYKNIESVYPGIKDYRNALICQYPV